MSINRCEEGLKLEMSLAKKLHCGPGVVPLLVSCVFLRKRRAGQVDVARIRNQVLEIFEVKKSLMVSPSQQRRLQVSADLLGKVMGLPSRLVFASSLKDCFAK